MKSYILELIQSNPDWRDIIENKHIRIKEEPPFAIFNYGADVDPLDPFVREARGIIIDLDKKKVVCWPFTRFYNAHEEAAQEDLENFDWDHCRVEEKVDGSLLKLWFNEYTSSWQWSTNSCINAANADTFSGMTFDEMIIQAGNYNEITFEALDKNCTYIFEIVSPYQQIVIRYPVTMLYHIGTRDNRTGEEDWRWIGVMHPQSFKLDSLDDCIRAAQALNKDTDKILNEGFVVVDQNWRRLKIKSPEYVGAHKLINNRVASKEKLLEVILDHPEDVDGACEIFPEMAVHLRYYQYKVVELEHDVDRFIRYVRSLFEEYNHDT